MADFATSLFLNHPHPTLVVCDCRRITAVNIAAEDLFRRPDIKQQSGSVQCGVTCHSNPSIEDLGITIQGGLQNWADVLHNSQKPAKKELGDKNDLSHSEFMVRFSQGLPANRETLRDSPMEPSFPAATNIPHTGETLRAKLSISSFSVDGIPQHMLVVSEVVVDRRGGIGGVDGSVQEEAWLDRCRDAMFDSLPRLGYIVDVDGKATHLNKYGEDYYRTAVIEMDWFESSGGVWDTTFTKQILVEDYPIMRIVRTQTALPPTDLGIFDPSTGEKIIARCWGFPLYDRYNGDFLGSVLYLEVLGTYTNLTERKRRDSLRSFETICDSMPHFVWTADQDGSGDWFSSQWLSFTGLQLQDLQGWGWKNSIHPDDLPRFMKTFREAHEKAAPYELEARCRRKDGVYRWMLKRGAPIKDDQGRVLRWVRQICHRSIAAANNFPDRYQYGDSRRSHCKDVRASGKRSDRRRHVTLQCQCMGREQGGHETDHAGGRVHAWCPQGRRHRES